MALARIEKQPPLSAPNTQPQPVEVDILQLDIDMTTPAARRALQAGLLEAKTQAMRKAARLGKAATPLLLGVIGVSFVHLWESVSVYKPEYVPALALPANVHYFTAGAFTLAIDAVAFYVIAAGDASTLAGAARDKSQRAALWFFLALTFVLNAAFIIRHAPALPAGFMAYALPALDLFNVFALPAFVPFAIMAVERAAHSVEATRLRLLVETTALAELVQSGLKPINASQSKKGPQPTAAHTSPQGGTAQPEQLDAGTAPAIGGRRQSFRLDDLGALLDGRDSITRAAIIEGLGCSETTADKLLRQAMEAGRVERVGGGVYAVR